MQAKVLSVYDEGATEDTQLIGAKGLSVLLEVDGQRTLFDTGLRGRYLLNNMEQLDIDPASLDRVVLSHGHRDHTGGLNALLSARDEPLDVFLPQGCLRAAGGRLSGLLDRGMPRIAERNLAKSRVREVSEWIGLSESLSLSSPVPGDVTEMVMVLRSAQGPVGICGCCHAGIAGVLSHVKAHSGSNPRALIGGTHLRKAGKERVAELSGALDREFGSPALYVNHCTGMGGIMKLRTNLGLSAVRDFYAGTGLEFEV
jgi:7,8-dihydropterin-6-yl-methyl-4-(beta-D-ribofuranosyl)aminobenzene 5'-phosphate synthase